MDPNQLKSGYNLVIWTNVEVTCDMIGDSYSQHVFQAQTGHVKYCISLHLIVFWRFDQRL